MVKKLSTALSLISLLTAACVDTAETAADIQYTQSYLIRVENTEVDESADIPETRNITEDTVAVYNENDALLY